MSQPEKQAKKVISTMMSAEDAARLALGGWKRSAALAAGVECLCAGHLRQISDLKEQIEGLARARERMESLVQRLNEERAGKN